MKHVLVLERKENLGICVAKHFSVFGHPGTAAPSSPSLASALSLYYGAAQAASPGQGHLLPKERKRLPCRVWGPSPSVPLEPEFLSTAPSLVTAGVPPPGTSRRQLLTVNSDPSRRAPTGVGDMIAIPGIHRQSPSSPIYVPSPTVLGGGQYNLCQSQSAGRKTTKDCQG